MLTIFDGKVLVSLYLPTIHGQEKLAYGFVPEKKLAKQDKTILQPKIIYNLPFDEFKVAIDLFEEEEIYTRGRKVIVAKGETPLIHDEFLNHLLSINWVVDHVVLDRHFLAISD